MLCILMVAGGYALLPVAAPCDDPRCLRVEATAGEIISPIPHGRWIQINKAQPLLACLEN